MMELVRPLPRFQTKRDQIKTNLKFFCEAWDRSHLRPLTYFYGLGFLSGLLCTRHTYIYYTH